MSILLSWSGKQSNAVAAALREWLNGVIPGVNPWMSATDIAPGTRWFEEIMKQLEQSTFCIICLTPDNVRSPWLYFEAGAIAAKSSDARVCGFLAGVSPSQLLPGPLAQFQCVDATLDGTWMLVREINKIATGNSPHDESLLKISFTSKWPELKSRVDQALLMYDPSSLTAAVETERRKRSTSFRKSRGRCFWRWRWIQAEALSWFAHPVG